MDQTAETSRDRDPRLRKNGKKRNRRCSLQFNNQGRRFLCILTRGYLSKKVTGVYGPENKKNKNPPIFFRGLRPIFMDF